MQCCELLTAFGTFTSIIMMVNDIINNRILT